MHVPSKKRHISVILLRWLLCASMFNKVFMRTKLDGIKIILDFDSTFVSVEGLEELAKITLRNNPHKSLVLKEIANITCQGMEGKICFEESLSRRVAMFNPTSRHMEELVGLLRNSVSRSIQENKQFFLENCEDIYIVSGGFKEWIAPVVEEYGIASGNLLANNFVYERGGKVIGIDANNPLTRSQGKVEVVRKLGLSNIVVVGDGYTDYEIKKEDAAQVFILFTENITRENLLDKADYIASDWNEVLRLISLISF